MELRSHVNIHMFILYLMFWVLFRIDPFQCPQWVLNKPVDVSTSLECSVRESSVLSLSPRTSDPRIFTFDFCHTTVLPSACPLLPQFYTLVVWWWWWWCLRYCIPSCLFVRLHKYFVFIDSNCLLLH